MRIEERDYYKIRILYRLFGNKKDFIPIMMYFELLCCVDDI